MTPATWESDCGTVKLWLGDCLEVIDGMQDDSIDSLIIDPPYCSGAVSEAARTRSSGQGVRSENLKRFGWFVGDNMGTAGLSFLLRSIAFHVPLKTSGSVLCFCDWRMVSVLQPSIESSGLRYQGLVVWNKGSIGLGTGFRAQHELILHFTAGSPEYFDRSFGNVLTVSRIGDERVHQTEKPVELLEPLVLVTSPIRGVVLDCFMGSGSVGVAAVRNQRSFYGIERDAEHFEMARNRIIAELNRFPLFEPKATQKKLGLQE